MSSSALLVLGATFLAAGVEWVEALTIVLAVGTTRGWRSAFGGTVAALVLLTAMVLLFGVALTAYVPIGLVRTIVGVFLLLFGLKWLHKAILRSSGLKSLHDEEKIYEQTRAELSLESKNHAAGFATAFNGVFLEGLEVVFIVVALGGLKNENIVPAAIGAVASVIVVVIAGIALRHPLTRVPENSLKYVVGIMLTAFGTFFAGEGLGVDWPLSDGILLVLIAVYAVASIAIVWYLRRPVRQPGEPGTAMKWARAAWAELWGLFVDDGALAIFTVAALLGVGLFSARYSAQHQLAGALLVVGVLLAIAVGLSGPAKARLKR